MLASRAVGSSSLMRKEHVDQTRLLISSHSTHRDRVRSSGQPPALARRGYFPLPRGRVCPKRPEAQAEAAVGSDLEATPLARARVVVWLRVAPMVAPCTCGAYDGPKRQRIKLLISYESSGPR